MKRLISNILSMLFLLASASTQAEIKIALSEGQKVQAFFEVKDTRTFKVNTAKIPLPPGKWQVTLIKPVVSSKGVAGLIAWLSKAVDGRVSELFILEAYPDSGNNWRPRLCAGGFLSRERGNSSSGYCHSLRSTTFMNNYKSDMQGMVRKSWTSQSLWWPQYQILYDASFEERGRFALYLQHGITLLAAGMPPQYSPSREDSQKIEEWWQKNQGLKSVSQVTSWYEDYAKLVAYSIARDGASPPESLTQPVDALWKVAIADVQSVLPEFGVAGVEKAMASTRPASEPNAPSATSGQRAEDSSNKQPTADANSDRITAGLQAPTQRQQELEEQLTKDRERLALAQQAQQASVKENEEQVKLEQKLLAAQKKQQELLEQLAKERERLALAQAEKSALRGVSIKNAHALVIGNSAYPGSARLRNTLSDAQAIDEKLRSMGFNVIMGVNTNRAQMLSALTRFKRVAAEADLSVLYYAGHGVQIDGVNYMLPTDIDQSDVEQATLQGVSLNTVVENFLPGKAKLVFLDACRDNPLQRTASRSLTKGLAPISVAQGTLISYATKDGQTAADGTGKHSPFTAALLEHIGDPQDIGVVLRSVRAKVMSATKGQQQPWEYGSLTGGELVLANIATK